MGTCDIGLIGLAVMGENLVLNMESHGFHVAVFNRTTNGRRFRGGPRARERIRRRHSLPDFVAALKRPRNASC